MNSAVKNQIKKDEGLRLMPYFDTEGKLTIGYGRNLADRGISQQEADQLFNNDIAICQIQLDQYDWYKNQPDPIKGCLINMCFNLGITKLLKFQNMIIALKAKDYKLAAKEALNSKWAKQVGDRAIRIAKIIASQK